MGQDGQGAGASDPQSSVLGPVPQLWALGPAPLLLRSLDPVLSLSCPCCFARRSVTFFLPCSSHSPSPVLSLFAISHIPLPTGSFPFLTYGIESVEATCSLPLSFEYTQSFILTPSPPSEPGGLTRTVILSWLHSAPSSLDISELNPTRHCVPLDLTCKLTAPLFSHPSRLFLFLFSRLMKCLVSFLHHLSNSSC